MMKTLIPLLALATTLSLNAFAAPDPSPGRCKALMDQGSKRYKDAWQKVWEPGDSVYHKSVGLKEVAQIARTFTWGLHNEHWELIRLYRQGVVSAAQLRKELAPMREKYSKDYGYPRFIHIHVDTSQEDPATFKIAAAPNSHPLSILKEGKDYLQFSFTGDPQTDLKAVDESILHSQRLFTGRLVGCDSACSLREYLVDYEQVPASCFDRLPVSAPSLPPTDAIRSVLKSMGFKSMEPNPFVMGSPEEEVGREDNETLHSVTLTLPYEIQTTEVTQAQWARVMGSNPSEFKTRKDCPRTHKKEAGYALCPHYPIENVTVAEIEEFIRRLNSVDGTHLYRLPTEAEWEAAARCGTKTAYSFGDDFSLLKEYAWHRRNSGERTHAVATRKPNFCGLYDMHGNVSELVEDWYLRDLARLPSADPMVGPWAGLYRVVRGGSYYDYEILHRSANRDLHRPHARESRVGLRLVRTRKAGE